MRIKRGRESDVILDIPMLHKKGFIKLPETPKLPGNAVYSEGYADYSNSPIYPSNSSQTSSSPSASDLLSSSGSVQSIPSSSSSDSPLSNPFDLLSSLASAGSSYLFPTTPNDSPSESSNTPKEFQHLKVKLEDMEYKLDRLLDRIALIESKLG